MKRQIKLTVAYDGTAYCGFQTQHNGISVESVLNQALSKIADHPVKILSASRTDSGVHALGQVATFFLEGTIPTARIPAALSGLLPPDIVVWEAREVPAAFHCRYDVVGKHYRYTVRNASLPSPFDYRYVHLCPGKLDETKIKEAAALLCGEHDFKAFTAAHSGREDFVRRLDQIDVAREGECLHFDFWGKAFLYKMVRSISGFLIDVGRGRRDLAVGEKALQSGDRALLGLTAPAKGLTLVKIYYNEEYFLDKQNFIS